MHNNLFDPFDLYYVAIRPRTFRRRLRSSPLPVQFFKLLQKRTLIWGHRRRLMILSTTMQTAVLRVELAHFPIIVTQLHPINSPYTTPLQFFTVRKIWRFSRRDDSENTIRARGINCAHTVPQKMSNDF